MNHQCFIFIVLTAAVTDASKILMLPWSFPSHIFQFAQFSELLIERGHEVHMVMAPTVPKVEKVRQGKVILHEHHIVEEDLWMKLKNKEFEEQIMKKLFQMNFIAFARSEPSLYLGLCTNPLSDGKLFQKLKEIQLDVAVVDAFHLSRCLAILAYRLDLPMISLTLAYEPWLLRSPGLPSFIPFFAAKGRSEKMTFSQRLQNTWDLMDWIIKPRLPYLENDFVAKYMPEKPPMSMDTLVGKSVLWLIDTDDLLDYPKPRMPNEIRVGGMTTEPAKPLSQDLEDYMNASPHGVVVVSFGSMASSLPLSVNTKLIKAFGKIKANIIWKYIGEQYGGEVPRNVKLMKWLPQNDLLGHMATKVFVTHCGANGQFEALYHGVPMLGFPLFAEQHYNAERMEYHGYGIKLNIHEFTEEEVAHSINTMMENHTYAEAIGKASAIYRGRPDRPVERVANAVEHYLEFGADHLRSHALDMPWYEWLMLDILVCFLMLLHAAFALVWGIVWYIQKQNLKKLKQQ